MKSVTLGGGPYSLVHVPGGYGDSGPMFVSLEFIEGDKGWRAQPKGDPGEIHVGCVVKCGSITGRSYSAQDWWQTSEVMEILEVNDEGDRRTVLFKTRNSTYKATGYLRRKTS